ncbi:TM2 domain-containing protein C41D11.9 [Tritrichomonas foetus]|uniref:TM2 domain-containing protein C41D11.9 n=1 Tax=Tritrichomonas foetus TaxID=1144522 RepID=A0A1J4JRV9_9EUKA|nr:TM2 domain-containing protein C41D11.9 [Tritrichomonas foetus]|eukprot:OHT01865.1 TM2 domain-containing protein C41D11.9 [Tritrichomonas foetus]
MNVFFILLKFCFSRKCLDYWPDHFICEVDKCTINSNISANCTVSPNFSCEGERSSMKTIPCIYCWQLPVSSLRCYFRDQCKPKPRPQPGSCSVLPNIVCLGTRTFGMQQYCKTASGYSWGLTIFLSLFFGGFGADRFYLGYIAFGFLKLLSLGGFGIWSMVDLILLCAGVLRPEDGSLFKEFASSY